MCEEGALLLNAGSNIPRPHSPGTISQVDHPPHFIALSGSKGMGPLVGMMIILKNRIHSMLFKQWTPRPLYFLGVSLYACPPGRTMIADELVGEGPAFFQGLSQPRRLWKPPAIG